MSIKVKFKWTKIEQYTFNDIKRVVACNNLLSHVSIKVKVKWNKIEQDTFDEIKRVVACNQLSDYHTHSLCSHCTKSLTPNLDLQILKHLTSINWMI